MGELFAVTHPNLFHVQHIRDSTAVEQRELHLPTTPLLLSLPPPSRGLFNVDVLSLELMFSTFQRERRGAAVEGGRSSTETRTVTSQEERRAWTPAE